MISLDQVIKHFPSALPLPPPQFLTGNKLYLIHVTKVSYVLYLEQFDMTLSDYVRCSRSMYVKIVLQNITWKENTNQKVSD